MVLAAVFSNTPISLSGAISSAILGGTQSLLA
jgi:hypothetical protein